MVVVLRFAFVLLPGRWCVHRLVVDGGGEFFFVCSIYSVSMCLGAETDTFGWSYWSVFHCCYREHWVDWILVFFNAAY